MGIRSWCGLGTVVACLVAAAPATATFYGENGRISFNRFMETEEDARADLFSVEPDGSRLRQVTNFGGFTFSEFSDHSPDGSTLAFQRFNFSGNEEEPQAAAQVWLTDADGRNARQLTAFEDTDGYEGAFDPAFSPHGDTLAIDAVDDGVAGIFLIPSRARRGKLITEADARRVTTAPPGTAFDSEPQFSPDGRWIVFTRFSEACNDPEAVCQTQIYRVRTNGKDLRLLADTHLSPSAPDWHPTGLAIAFDVHDSTFAPNEGHIMVMLPDGSHKRAIVRGDSDSHYGNPSFSPDGTRVAFTHWPLGPDGNPDDSQGSSIWTAWVTGAKLRQVTRGALDNKADWGPRPRRGHGHH